MPFQSYQNFDLHVTHDPAGYTARVLASPAGQATERFTLPWAAAELRQPLILLGDAVRNLRPTPSGPAQAAPLAPKELGAQLYAALCGSEVGVALLRSLDAAQDAGAGLRVRLRLSETPELAALPWEYLYDPTRDRFLALAGELSLVRYLELPEPERVLRVNPPLRILAVIADPTDLTPRLDVGREWALLQTALADLVAAGQVVLDRLPTATADALQQRLRQDEVHVLHFIGHGWFEAGQGSGSTPNAGLLWEDEQTQARPLTADVLGVLLHGHPALRLLFLNACEGARSDNQDAFAGVAQHLVRQGLPAVIAMQFPITDVAAIRLAQEFYRALSDGYPVDAALTEARKAVYAQGSLLEWGTPVFFSRSLDNRILVQPESTAANAASGGAPAPTVTQISTGGGDLVGRDKITIVVSAPDQAVTLSSHLQRQAELLQPELERKLFEPETILIPAGPFRMGAMPAPGIPEAETPQHTVVLRAYRIGKYPVTNREYAEFLAHDKSRDEPKGAGWFARKPRSQKLDHPVVGVSWQDAYAYCAWLSTPERAYCLPTEAEWEKAARGRDGRRYPWGEEWAEGYCNVDSNDTSPVTAFQAGASTYGCLDLLGNVQEWTSTLWGSDLRVSDYTYPYHADDGREDAEADRRLPVVVRIHRGCVPPAPRGRTL